jgi:hypothetical protein
MSTKITIKVATEKTSRKRPSEKDLCHTIKKNGERCKNRACKDKKYCKTHDSESSDSDDDMFGNLNIKNILKKYSF